MCDKRFSAYSKTTSLFQTGVWLSQRICMIRVFSTSLKSLNQLVWQNHKSICPRRRCNSKARLHSRTDREVKALTTALVTDQWRASQNHTTVSQITPQVNYQPSGDTRGSSKTQVNGVLRRPLGVALVGRTFRCHFALKTAEPYWEDAVSICRLASLVRLKRQFLDWASDHSHIVNPGIFSAKIFDRPKTIVLAQLKKTYSHPPVWHKDFSGNLRLANAVTNAVNVLTRLGFQHDQESVGVLGRRVQPVPRMLRLQ